MQRYHDLELAPRDIVVRAILKEMAVPVPIRYFGSDPPGPGPNKTRFLILKTCAEYQLDITVDPIPYARPLYDGRG